MVCRKLIEELLKIAAYAGGKTKFLINFLPFIRCKQPLKNSMAFPATIGIPVPPPLVLIVTVLQQRKPEFHLLVSICCHGNSSRTSFRFIHIVPAEF